MDRPGFSSGQLATRPAHTLPAATDGQSTFPQSEEMMQTVFGQLQRLHAAAANLHDAANRLIGSVPEAAPDPANRSDAAIPGNLLGKIKLVADVLDLLETKLAGVLKRFDAFV